MTSHSSGQSFVRKVMKTKVFSIVLQKETVSFVNFIQNYSKGTMTSQVPRACAGLLRKKLGLKFVKCFRIICAQERSLNLGMTLSYLKTSVFARLHI